MRLWLKNFRVNKNLTQKDTAKLSGISRSYYTHIEQGNKTPTVDVSRAIANTLDFNWTIFFNNECSFKEPREQPERII